MANDDDEEKYVFRLQCFGKCRGKKSNLSKFVLRKKKESFFCSKSSNKARISSESCRSDRQAVKINWSLWKIYVENLPHNSDYIYRYIYYVPHISSLFTHSSKCVPLHIPFEYKQNMTKNHINLRQNSTWFIYIFTKLI